jgi:exosortase H (IPTLxxWG-CTERM-specific)
LPDHGPARLRLGLVVGALLAVVLFTPRAPVLTALMKPLDILTARATAAVVQGSGLEVARDGAVLSHPSGFAYEIYWRCTGLLPSAFLAAVILASPGGRRSKAVGIAAGVLVVLGVNLVRLAHLFSVGVRHPALFDFAHTIAWEGIGVLLVLGLWWGWMRWSLPTRSTRSRPG